MFEFFSARFVVEKKRIQISFNVDQETHTRLKIKAAKMNVSMNWFLMQLIYKALKEEREG